jgi:hypothetical protein
MRILNFKVEAENFQKYLFIGQNERFPSLRFLMELSASSPSLSFLVPPLRLSGYGWGPLPRSMCVWGLRNLEPKERERFAHRFKSASDLLRCQRMVFGQYNGDEIFEPLAILLSLRR